MVYCRPKSSRRKAFGVRVRHTIPDTQHRNENNQVPATVPATVTVTVTVTVIVTSSSVQKHTTSHLVALDQSTVLHAPDVQVPGKRSAHQIVTLNHKVTKPQKHRRKGGKKQTKDSIRAQHQSTAEALYHRKLTTRKPLLI